MMGVDVDRGRANRYCGIGKLSDYSDTNCIAGVTVVEEEERRVKMWIRPTEQPDGAHEVLNRMIIQFHAHPGFAPLFKGALTTEILRVDLVHTTAGQMLEFIRRGFREMHDDRRLVDFRYSRVVFRGVPSFRTIDAIVRGTDAWAPVVEVNNENTQSSTFTNDKALLHGIS
jgi:hypothetical protein